MSTAGSWPGASGSQEPMSAITTIAPAKAILFGEHAVNRGQTALAVSVGLHASCRLEVLDACAPSKPDDQFHFSAGQHVAGTRRQDILALGRAMDGALAGQDYAAIQRLSADDFFAPAKYVLAALGDALPDRLQVAFTSAIPQSAGLGSGGATFVALAAALAQLLGRADDLRLIASWALRGDIIAHGGMASGLDTQTSLYGGAIRYTSARQAEPIPYADGLLLVIGNTGVFAATSLVNGRVRKWLAERPVRMHYFQGIGLLSHHAEVALRAGDWIELGRLLNLNQLILERIGVSCPELELLNEAALAAGALGAKLAGSGGGGIMIALVTPDRVDPVARAIRDAGGQAIIAPVGVPGVRFDG
jgi:mevalonate kinase